MSEWWDEGKQRYRYSLPYKVFYVWLWPIENFVMVHFMSREFAHYFALHIAIPFVGFVDRLWTVAKVVVVLAIVIPLFLLSKLPGCSWKPDNEAQNDG